MHLMRIERRHVDLQRVASQLCR
ncbi:putative leader peptide [Arsenicicoccus sp. oral taxon 190]